jgi:hypothetical protein
MTEDLSRFCCLNEQCPDHGKRGVGNLTVCARYGRDKQRRLLYCRPCQSRSSERKGTPLFGSQWTEEKAVSIFEHLLRGFLEMTPGGLREKPSAMGDTPRGSPPALFESDVVSALQL